MKKLTDLLFESIQKTNIDVETLFQFGVDVFLGLPTITNKPYRIFSGDDSDKKHISVVSSEWFKGLDISFESLYYLNSYFDINDSKVKKYGSIKGTIYFSDSRKSEQFDLTAKNCGSKFKKVVDYRKQNPDVFIDINLESFEFFENGKIKAFTALSEYDEYNYHNLSKNGIEPTNMIAVRILESIFYKLDIHSLELFTGDIYLKGSSYKWFFEN